MHLGRIVTQQPVTTFEQVPFPGPVLIPYMKRLEQNMGPEAPPCPDCQ